jgi:putative peptidoglycan binding protein
MRLIKGSLAGLVLTGILAIVPAAAFAHGGGGGGGGGHVGGGGGHGLGGGRGGHASIAGGHAFSKFTGRGFSPGFRGMRVFSSGRFSGRGDDGRFRDRDFGHHGNFRDRDERHHRHFFNDFDFVAFGFPDWWYPDDGYSDEDAYDDSAPAYGDQYWQDLAMKVQWALSRRGYYHGPIDGVIGPDDIRAIRAFQEAQGWPATGQIDPNVLRALKLPIPQVALRSN